MKTEKFKVIYPMHVFVDESYMLDNFLSKALDWRATMHRKYPQHPLVGIGAVIVQGDEILVVKRANEPSKGLWSIPGGVVELGERLQDAIKREVNEETGLEIDVVRLLEAVDNIVYDEKGRIRYHYVLLDYLCQPRGGSLRASDDVLEVQWVTMNALQSLPTTTSLNRVIAKLGDSLFPLQDFSNGSNNF